jgi:hypothetical protein
VKVMVIPEDPTLDQYILKPVIERLFLDLGRKARVQVLSNPRIRGVAQALDAAIVARIVAMYPMIDLFCVMVDRDGEAERRPLEARMREQEHPDRLMVCLAVEEVEVWMLALHRERLDAPWQDVRSERDPKERFAARFLATHAPRLSPGHGRVWAMSDLGSKWRGVLTLCPELEDLKQRLGAWLVRHGE